MRRLTNDIWNLITVSSQTKPGFSLVFRDSFLILLGLVARMGVTGGTKMFRFVTGMSFRTGVARWTITGRTPKFRAFAWTKPFNVINNTQNSPQTYAWMLTFAVPGRAKLEGQNARCYSCKKHKILSSLSQNYSFPQGKLQLSLTRPDKDKYDTRDKKQLNLLQLMKQPGPA